MYLSTVLVLYKPHFRCTFYICKYINLFLCRTYEKKSTVPAVCENLEIFTAKKEIQKVNER